jgi:cytochrome c oxidase cbb3-type subunit 3
MKPGKLLVLLGLLLAAGLEAGQEPATAATRGAPVPGSDFSAAAIAGAKQDPAAVDRGGKAFATSCAGCHGAGAKGGPGAPDLVRSLLVLDDEKGILIAPVIREGRPDKGMPKLGLSEAQIADIVAWLHVKTYSAGHRGTYVFQDVVTGDPKKGESYFNGSGGCSGCHSASGDLAHIGTKYDPFALQSHWLQPRERRTRGGGTGGGAKASGAGHSSEPSLTVTPASGPAVSGTLDHIDDFVVSLRDSSGAFHSFAREGDTPKIEIKDPLKAHTDMLRRYTDADIHNMTAYLVTLK